jgi:membrane carboxypeptidase/penicillin-binding protein
MITQGSNSTISNSSADYMTGNKAGKIDGSVGIRDAGAACANLNGIRLNQCIQGYDTAFNTICKTTKFGCNG